MRVRRNKEEWFELVEGFDRSLVSLNEYCKLHNISTASYYVYLRKYKQETQAFFPVVIEEEKQLDTIIFKSNGFNLEVNKDIPLNELRLLLEATSSDF